MAHEPEALMFSACIEQMRATVTEAAAIAKAAAECAHSESIDTAFDITLDIEPLLREANILLQAASIIRRKASSSP